MNGFITFCISVQSIGQVTGCYRMGDRRFLLTQHGGIIFILKLFGL